MGKANSNKEKKAHLKLDQRVYGINSTISKKEVCNFFNLKMLPQVSNFGRFKRNGRIVTPSIHPSGYSTIIFYNYSRYAHIIAAATFDYTPKTPKHITVDHIKVGFEHRSNNALTNLRLATREQQIQSSHDLNKTRKSSAQAREKPILYRKCGEQKWLNYSGTSAFARDFEMDQGNLTTTLKRRQKTSGGYEFKYAEIADLEGEIWKSVIIDNAESGTFVSNKLRFKDTAGTIKTVDFSEGHRREVKINGRGYLFNILVYAAFNNINIDPECKGLREGFEVDHINGIGTDDYPENLQLITISEHKKKSNTATTRKSHGPSKSIPFLAKKVGDEDWTEFPNLCAASDELKLDQGSISRAIRIPYKDGSFRRLKAPDGNIYEFKRVPDEESQQPISGEIWMDIYPKHCVPNYFKTLADSIFTCQVCND